jgi:hypothetical protein
MGSKKMRPPRWVEKYGSLKDVHKVVPSRGVRKAVSLKEVRHVCPTKWVAQRGSVKGGHLGDSQGVPWGGNQGWSLWGGPIMGVTQRGPRGSVLQ